MGQAQTSTSRNRRRIKTVLIVEDYDDSRTLLKLLLEGDDYHVLEATSGPEGLKTATVQNPDIILMDIGLPGFDGLETVRRIRQVDRLRRTPIVVMSAYSGLAYHQAVRQAGGDFFITKPVDFDRLEALLARLDSGRTFQQRHADPNTQRGFEYKPRNRNHQPELA